MQNLGRILVRRRVLAAVWIVVATVLALGALASSASEGLPVDFTPQALFERDAENEEVLQRTRAAWGRDDNDVVVVVSGDVLARNGLAALAALHDVLATDRDVVTVDSLANASLAWRGPEGVRVGRLLDENTCCEDLAERIADEASVTGLLVSASGRLATLRARIRPDIERVADLQVVTRRLERAVAEVELPGGMSVELSGVPYVRVEVVDLLVRDQTRFFPIDAVLFGAVLLWLFRRPFPGLLPLLAVGLAVLWSTAALVAGGFVFNVLSTLIPILVLVIGLADGIHLLTRYRDELAVDGSRELAMGRTLQHLAHACFLTSFTTAVGFASLATSRSDVVREFGLTAGVSVLMTYAVVVTALPTMLAFVPEAHVLSGVGRTEDSRLTRALDRLAVAVERHPRNTLVGCGTLTLVALFFAGRVGTNSALFEFYGDDHPSVALHDTLVDELGGIVPVYAHLEADRPGAFREPEVLEAVSELQARMLARDEVRWATSTADVVGAVHRLMTGEVGLPRDGFMLEQELLLVDMGAEQLGLDRLVDQDWQVARVLGLSDDAGGLVFVDLKQAIEAAGDELLSPLGVTVTGAGDGIVASAGVHRMIDDLIASVAVAFGVISLTLLATLRSAKLTVIAMVPNMLPLVFTLAALGAAGLDLTTSNVVSFAVALGLAVDNTIHFLVRLQEERARLPDVGAAIRATFRGTGTPIVFTSVLLMIGLGVMLASDARPTQQFAGLALATLVSALVADLALLPALVHVSERSR